MSDRGSSEPVKNPKFIDLKDFVGLKQKVEATVRAPDGRRAYRSLDELANTDEFRAMMNREFPQAASEWDDGVSRRNFMKLMGASIALAGLTTACAPKPEEKIVPYVQQPENLVPGRALFYASAMPFGGYGKGVVVEQHEGRPTKIEGNRDHPSSLGGADIWGQASILSLYDPDRAQLPMRFGNVSTWGQFMQSFSDMLAWSDWQSAKSVRRNRPARVRILSETITSPTIAAQIAALGKVLPDLKWHTFDPVGRDNTVGGVAKAFGQKLEPVYHFDRAKVVVSLDCNFLTDEPGSLRYARDYISQRKVSLLGRKDSDLEVPARVKPNNRLYVAESSPTVVGAMADHKFRGKPEQIHAFAVALYDAVKNHKHDGVSFPGAPWFPHLVEELFHDAKGASIVVAGEYAPAEVHVLAHAINQELQNIASAPGEAKPIEFIPAVNANPVNSVESLTELVAALKANEVDALIILGGNPAYSAPADLGLEALLNNIYTGDMKAARPFVANLSLYEDETARVCEWHLPEAHYLEAWGDIRGHDGTASIIQPLIAPLYPGCKSAVELLAGMLQKASPAAAATTQPATAPADAAVAAARTGYDAVRATWRAFFESKNPGGDFEQFWTLSVHDGVIGKSQTDPAKPALTTFAAVAVGPVAADAVAAASKVTVTKGMTLNFRPDPNVWDGSWSNNAWLQELPKPLTKITWDNALLISPRAAGPEGFGLSSTADGNVFKQKYIEALGKTVDITVNGKTLKGVPVWVVPGHPDHTATLHLGYGRRFAGRVGSPIDGQVGFDAYALRSSTTRWSATDVDVKPAGGTYQLAVTQNHQIINHELNHKRELVLTGTSVGGVANHLEHEIAQKFGDSESSHTHGDEYKRKPEQNLALARRIGLPILPDDPANSPKSLFPEQPDHPGGHDPLYPAWGMVIDQTACIGCNACVIACQSENNIPVVGKEQVYNEREMHWLRIDTYYVGKPPEGDEHGHSDTVNIADPDHTFFQPVPCMQCEKAPCELVCPVGATVHSKEGLNDMAYNRCVGTRYCSNNCPYKVRRFNFLKWVGNDDTTPVLKLLRNPEVTVRSRGVMEKCTYCTQRISRGRIEAKKAEVKWRSEQDWASMTPEQTGQANAESQKIYNRGLREIMTACQQSCPTEAIIFGNMADMESPIRKHKEEPVGFHYGLLAELNTRPRTTYFARIDNPHPEMAAAAGHGHDHSHDHKDEKTKSGEAGKAH